VDEARIALDPAVREGRPHIAGTQLTVADVLKLMASGAPLEKVRQDHPELPEAAFALAMHYAVAVLEALDPARDAAIHVAAARRLAELAFDQGASAGGKERGTAWETLMGFTGFVKQ
jgi:uncharacterized protein (DUF433 family)